VIKIGEDKPWQGYLSPLQAIKCMSLQSLIFVTQNNLNMLLAYYMELFMRYLT